MSAKFPIDTEFEGLLSLNENYTHIVAGAVSLIYGLLITVCYEYGQQTTGGGLDQKIFSIGSETLRIMPVLEMLVDYTDEGYTHAKEMFEYYEKSTEAT